MLVGNKTDLHQERAVSAEEGRKLAESWRANFLETSAKQNEVYSNIEINVIHTIFIIIPFEFSVCSPWPIFSIRYCYKSRKRMAIPKRRAVASFHKQDSSSKQPYSLLWQQQTNKQTTTWKENINHF